MPRLVMKSHRRSFPGVANQHRSQLTSIPGLPFVACSSHLYGMTNRVRHIHVATQRAVLERKKGGSCAITHAAVGGWLKFESSGSSSSSSAE